VAKRKKVQPWDAVFDQVRIARPVSWVCAPPATAVEVEAVEARLKSPLPPSYREFMMRFGPGELYAVQLHPFASSSSDWDVVSHTLDCRECVEQFGDRFADAEWFTQLVYFASTAGGDWYGWNPSEKSRSHPREHPCYHVHHDYVVRVIDVGNTFWEFVAWVDADFRAWSESESGESPPAGIEFCPQRLRDKKAPAKKHVKLWLSWNNNTVRDLALAIRDRGQTDAFPVLADALQEAGCDNADLLDSCRTGAPDIDGRWALQVLLGEE
jgi:hypothetical protein